ncbi:MAG TPA: bifunctional adenosylcobinamide kinase/adenosylcobinamide-phosphate guanylyltransferase [Anaerolineaceae bacterium]|nr:bifunctional adenosylcobinamide kinase/adenosylcobinamide-phosphate guanylyltransferase [Anaerolineaceae bacterium]
MGQQLTLIMGGARSGKSDYAQFLVQEDEQPALFVATATAGDEEMANRIAVHRANRPENWQTLEAPLNIGTAIQNAPPFPWVLVDCITLLVSNLLMTCAEPVDERGYHAMVEREMDELIASYSIHTGKWVVVSNEVGLGLVPAYPLGRYYRDALGRANQRIAKIADRAILMVAGIPMIVKE